MLGRNPPFLVDYLNQPKKSIFPPEFINHFMDTDPWWIDPERNQPRRYVLNSQDRLYCAHGECGSYNEAKLIERIRDNRIKEFPERIQDLVDDIMLVHYSDQEFLDSEEWDQLWRELIDVDQRSIKISKQNILSPIDSSNEAQFGFELGRVLGLLTSTDSPVEPLIWGILQGILASGAKDVEGQIDVIEYIIAQFENRMEDRRREAENIIKNSNLINKSSENIEERLNTCLHANDIKATAGELGIVDLFVGRIIQYQDYDLEEDVESYIKQRNLPAVDSLRQRLEQDSKIVENRIKQGVEVYKVLQYMHNESRVDQSIETEDDQPPPTPPEYIIKSVHKDQFPFSSKKRHMLVAVLNRLSSKADCELYTNKPVVEQAGNEWRLTIYGDLLTHTVFEQKDSTWVYTYSTDQHNLRTRQKELINEFVSSI